MKKLLLGSILATCASASFAQTFWNGAITASDPTFSRPLQDGTGLGSATAAKYDVQPFWVSVTGNYTFESSQNYDGFIIIYKDVFTPSTSLVNFVAGDDDETQVNLTTGVTTLLAGTNGSKITTVALDSTKQYFAITTAFSNSGQGNYANGIGRAAGQSTGFAVLGLNPVPEPASMVALGIGAAAMLRRRKK